MLKSLNRKKTIFFKFSIYSLIGLVTKMNKNCVDPKVKKTLVKNCVQNVGLSARNQVVYEVDEGSSRIRNLEESSRSSIKENELNHPTLCSSEVLATYMYNVKKKSPLTSNVDLNIDKSQLNAQITKKLNFHFNDRIYKNLVELNADVENLKIRKDKRSTSCSIKRDLEPNIEDFYDDEKEPDSPPNIPVIKIKFKPVKSIENGSLHKLVSNFEDL